MTDGDCSIRRYLPPVPRFASNLQSFSLKATEKPAVPAEFTGHRAHLCAALGPSTVLTMAQTDQPTTVIIPGCLEGLT